MGNGGEAVLFTRFTYSCPVRFTRFTRFALNRFTVGGSGSTRVLDVHTALKRFLHHPLYAPTPALPAEPWRKKAWMILSKQKTNAPTNLKVNTNGSCDGAISLFSFLIDSICFTPPPPHVGEEHARGGGGRWGTCMPPHPPSPPSHGGRKPG